MRLIDADELTKDIEYSADMGGVLGKVVEYVKYYAKYMVTSSPTIEERKTGKWEQDNPFTKPRCSECGEPCFGLHGFDYTLTPYCPNCGADMRGWNER